MGGSTNPTGGPKNLLLAFGAGLVIGYFACHFHVCSWVGLCEPATMHPPGLIDPGPR